jgi:tetratricopeptide (TPR) repeat protein
LWGAVLAELHDYEAAIEKFRLTIRYLPKHPEAHFFWSIALNRLGRHEEAIEKATQALVLNPNKPEIYLNLGDALANSGRFQEAAEHYQHALTLEPDMAEAHLSWAVAAYKSGQFDKAFEHLKLAEELQEDLPGLAQHWGIAHVQNQQFAEAIPYLQKAHQEDTDHVDILLNWALALAKTGQTNAALDKLIYLEKRDRWNPNVHYMLGTHFLGLGEFQKAVEHLLKALEEQPDYEDAAINLALALSEIGNTIDAVRTMRPVIRRLPNSAQVNFYYGTMLYRNGDLRDALEKYDRAIELNPDYLEPKIGKGEIFLKQEKHAEAQQILDTVLEKDPLNVPSLFLKGLTLIRQAELPENANKTALYQESLGIFERIIAHVPEHIDSWANRAYLKGRLESIDVMNHEFFRLVNQYRGEIQAILFYYWGKVLDQFDQPQEAEEKRQMARDINPAIEKQFEIFSL